MDLQMLPRICLASASPRRLDLLASLGVECDVMPADIDESIMAGEAADRYVHRMAAEKAAAVQTRLDDARVVLAADTTVVVDGNILSKPADKDDAARMLRMLSGRSHEVLSAVAVIDGDQHLTDASRTVVDFRVLSDSEIEDYWATGEPADKAGAYGIQGLGGAFVQQLHGSYSGVVGLPLFETARLMNRLGYRLM